VAKMKRLLVALLILAGTAVLFGRAVHVFRLSGSAFSGLSDRGDKTQDTITRAFDVSPGGSLVVQAEEGSIEVRAADVNRVDVEVIRRVEAYSRDEADRVLKSIEVRFSQDGNMVRVESESPRSKARKHVEFKISVPRSFNLDLRTSGGSVEVAGIKGEVRSKTSGGGLRFTTIQGDVTGKTSGGSIALSDITGEVNAETSGGGITVENVSGAVDARTSGGSINARRVTGRLAAKTSGGGMRIEEVSGPIEAQTSGGSITARFSKQPQEDCQLHTSGGSVDVSIPEGAKVNFDAEVSGGHVETDFPIAMTVQGKLDGSMLKGAINGGGPLLLCRTSGSSIRLRRATGTPQ
jgi:hypothetical protein